MEIIPAAIRIPHAFVREGFPDRRRIVVIPLRLREQEQVLMRLRRPVGDTDSGIGFGLCQMMSLPEVPAVGLEGEGDTPGDADQVFRLEAGRTFDR